MVKKSDEPELESETIPLKVVAFTTDYDRTYGYDDYRRKYITFKNQVSDDIRFTDNSKVAVKVGTPWSRFKVDEENVSKLATGHVVFVITKDDSKMTKNSKDGITHLNLADDDVIIALSGGTIKEEDLIIQKPCTLFRKDKRPETVSIFDAISYIAQGGGESSLDNSGIPKPSKIASYLGYTVPDNYTPKQGGIKKAEKKA